jgi:hypothetical protein
VIDTFVNYIGEIPDDVWECVSPMLVAALDRGPPTHRLFDVRNLIEDGRANLIVFYEGESNSPRLVTVLEITTFPRIKACNVIWIGGRGIVMRSKFVFETIKDFALHNGCGAITGTGRFGWGRFMPNNFHQDTYWSFI